MNVVDFEPPTVETGSLEKVFSIYVHEQSPHLRVIYTRPFGERFSPIVHFGKAAEKNLVVVGTTTSLSKAVRDMRLSDGTVLPAEDWRVTIVTSTILSAGESANLLEQQVYALLHS